jgi:hypothetical protein
MREIKLKTVAPALIFILGLAAELADELNL